MIPVLTIPLWDGFISGVLNVDEYEKVIGLVLTRFYILKITLMDSVFYEGSPELLAYQSIITNVCVYGVAFVGSKHTSSHPR